MRTRNSLLLCAALLVFPATTWAQGADAAVKQGAKAWMDAFTAGDAATLASLYSEDALLLAPGAEPIEGREAIQAYWQTAMDATPGATAQLTTREVHAMGNGVAVEVGAFVLTDADGGHLDHGKYVVVWKRTDDGWKLARDIYNSSMSM